MTYPSEFPIEWGQTLELFDPEREGWQRIGESTWKSPGRFGWWCRLDLGTMQLCESELFDRPTYDGDVLTAEVVRAIIEQNGGDAR